MDHWQSSRFLTMESSLSLPNPDDGKVSVASSRTDGMCAHLLLPIAHPFIMKDATFITEVLTYFATGKFLSTKSKYLNCEHRARADYIIYVTSAREGST